MALCTAQLNFPAAIFNRRQVERLARLHIGQHPQAWVLCLDRLYVHQAIVGGEHTFPGVGAAA
ncbi:hypothetical protein D3C78_1861680 [compost metagenome]